MFKVTYSSPFELNHYVKTGFEQLSPTAQKTLQTVSLTYEDKKKPKQFYTQSVHDVTKRDSRLNSLIKIIFLSRMWIISQGLTFFNAISFTLCDISH